jgi:hypothetical protein
MKRKRLHEKVAKIIEQYNYYINEPGEQCKTIPYENEYGEPVYVEIDAFHDGGIWLEGEFGYDDLVVLSKALKEINIKG